MAKHFVSVDFDIRLIVRDLVTPPANIDLFSSGIHLAHLLRAKLCQLLPDYQIVIGQRLPLTTHVRIVMSGSLKPTEDRILKACHRVIKQGDWLR